MLTAPTLWAFIDQHRRVTGRCPSFREVVDHFDEKRLNVLMALGELTAEQKSVVRGERKKRGER